MYFANCDFFMRVNAIFRQLLLSKETGVGILTASFLLSALPLSLNAVAQPTTPPTSSPSTSQQDIQPLNNTPAPAPSSAPGAGSTQPSPLPPANNTPALGPSPATGASIPVGETDYTLGAGDLLRIDIFQVKDYSGQYPVLVDGTVSLPLIGRIQAEGQTLKKPLRPNRSKIFYLFETTNYYSGFGYSSSSEDSDFWRDNYTWFLHGNI